MKKKSIWIFLIFGLHLLPIYGENRVAINTPPVNRHAAIEKAHRLIQSQLPDCDVKVFPFSRVERRGLEVLVTLYWSEIYLSGHCDAMDAIYVNLALETVIAHRISQYGSAENFFGAAQEWKEMHFPVVQSSLLKIPYSPGEKQLRTIEYANKKLNYSSIQYPEKARRLYFENGTVIGVIATDGYYTSFKLVDKESGKVRDLGYSDILEVPPENPWVLVE